MGLPPLMDYLETSLEMLWVIKTPQLGAKEMAQLVKCLWFEHEDLRLDPQTPLKTWHSSPHL